MAGKYDAEAARSRRQAKWALGWAWFDIAFAVYNGWFAIQGGAIWWLHATFGAGLAFLAVVSFKQRKSWLKGAARWDALSRDSANIDALRASRTSVLDLGDAPFDQREDGSIREGDPAFDFMMRAMESGGVVHAQRRDDGKWDVTES